MGSLERVICFPKIGDLRLAKIGAGGKPLVGDSLRTFGPHEKNLSIFDSIRPNKTLRTHWDGNQLRFMRFPPVGINEKLIEKGLCLRPPEPPRRLQFHRGRIEGEARE